MPLQSNLWFAAVSPADVPKPNPGYYALFISNGGNNTAAGFVHKKDSNGDVSTAVNSPDDYSDEQARDAVGSILSDSDSIQILYDDYGNFIAATVIEGSLNATHIVNGGITTPKIADQAITTAKIADGAVTGQQLGGGTVTATHIADGAVATSELGDGAVTDVKLADDAVTNTKIGNAAVTNSKLADNAVGNAKIADAAVSTSKLTALAVGTTNLADAAVTAVKLAQNSVGTPNLLDGSVTAAKHADNSVTNAKLAGASVGSTNIIDAAVTGAKLALSAVATGNIVDSSITNTKIATDAVTNAKIADAAVNTAEIADAAITTVKQADASTTTAKLADGAVTTVKLATDAVTNAKIADAAVNTAELADTAVTNAKLATMAAATFKMRAAGAGTGAPIDGTAAQAKTALAITASDVSGLGTAATVNSTTFDAAGLAAAAQAASQPLDSDLTAIAALSTTAYGRALLTLADATASTALLNTATASLKGLMSATDKTRLDNTQAGIYNVLNYGVTTTDAGGLTNVSSLQALLNTIPDNSTVWFPPGPGAYRLNGTITIPAGKHLRIEGSSNQKSILQAVSGEGDMFQVGDWYNEFHGLKFTTTTTRTSGAAINSGNNVAVNVYDCDFVGMYDGIVYTGGINAGNLAIVSNCGFTGTLNRGIVLDGTNANTIIEKVVMDGTLGQQVVGLDLLQCGSALVSNCDFIRAQNNVRFNPASPNGVFSAYFVNTFFDTSSASSVLFTNTGNVQRVKFTNCWFSGSVTGCEFASTATTLPTAIDFVNCDIFGNSSRGIYAHGVQDFSVTNCRIAGNTTAGIEVAASTGSVTKFNLTNNSICPTAGFAANGTGVLINAGTYGGYAIKNNDLRNNTTNNLTDNGSVATTDLKIVNDNFGHLITGSIGNIATTATIGGSTEGVILAARIPAKAVAAGQVFRIRAFGNATGGTVAFRVRIGTAGNTSDTQAWISVTSATLAANNRAGFDGLLTIRTAGASGTAQCEALGFGNATLLPTVTAAPATATINTTTAWFITLTVATSLGGGYIAQQAVVEAL